MEKKGNKNYVCRIKIKRFMNEVGATNNSLHILMYWALPGSSKAAVQLFTIHATTISMKTIKWILTLKNV